MARKGPLPFPRADDKAVQSAIVRDSECLLLTGDLDLDFFFLLPLNHVTFSSSGQEKSTMITQQVAFLFLLAVAG